MIEILQEVTDWGEAPVANGIYHVNSAGHLVQHNDKIFKAPIKGFSKSRRKFEKIGEYEEQLPDFGIVVKGSTGKSYIIIEGKCSCPGFKFRGDCKHVRSVA
jgi:predicted nucleic acid-binding Zn finger protein